MARQDEYTRYTMRIPTPLYERIKSAAGEKSVNAEILATLEREYPGQESLAALRAALSERVQILSRAYNEEEERRLQAEIMDLVRRIEIAASFHY